MSLSPTMCEVSPLATVDTMSLGKANGSASRMTAEARAVPHDPSIEITPCKGEFD